MINTIDNGIDIDFLGSIDIGIDIDKAVFEILNIGIDIDKRHMVLILILLRCTQNIDKLTNL